MNYSEEVTTAIILTLTLIQPPELIKNTTLSNIQTYKPAQEILTLEDLNLAPNASDDCIRQALEDATDKQVIGFVLMQGGYKVAEWAAGEVGGEPTDAVQDHEGIGSDPMDLVGPELLGTLEGDRK